MSRKICYFKIRPIDTMFFRDGTPFNKDLNSNFIEVKDVPYPSVFYGAIFSALLRQGKFKEVLEEIKNKNESAIEQKSKEVFRIKNIFIYDEEENKVFTKAPLDLFKNEEDVVFGKYENGSFNSSNKEGYKRADEFYIDVDDLFNDYKMKKNHKLKLYPRSYFFKNYVKTGLDLREKPALELEEKPVYRITMTEFASKKFSYMLQCELDENSMDIKKDIILLGGESKMASLAYTNKEISLFNKINDYKDTNCEFVKFILISPMIIENDEKLNGKCEFIQITGKAEYIGGYNLASGEQKPIKRAIPAGSLFILKNTKENVEKIKSLSEENNFRGFGKFITIPWEGGN